MPKLLERAYRRFPLRTDWLLAALLRPCAYLFRAYRRFGSARLPQTTRMLRTVGIFPILHFYYEPLFNPYILPRPLGEDRFLPGINLNVSAQLTFLASLQFAAELRALHWDKPASHPNTFDIHNRYFGYGDAEFFYQLLRTLKPRRLVEIGSGFSTRVAQVALARNTDETAITPTHRCIEPFEPERLTGLQGIDLIRTPLEDCAIDWSTELSSGDLLFIDSSHIIRPQGDVLKEYLDILPQLPSGVYVHIHDIFTPRDYPSRWLEEDVLFWNEQYLLEALLSNTQRYEIVAALNFLKHHHYDPLREVCPYLTPDKEPASFYIKVR